MKVWQYQDCFKAFSPPLKGRTMAKKKPVNSERKQGVTATVEVPVDWERIINGEQGDNPTESDLGINPAIGAALALLYTPVTENDEHGVDVGDVLSKLPEEELQGLTDFFGKFISGRPNAVTVAAMMRKAFHVQGRQIHLETIRNLEPFVKGPVNPVQVAMGLKRLQLTLQPATLEFWAANREPCFVLAMCSVKPTKENIALLDQLADGLGKEYKYADPHLAWEGWRESLKAFPEELRNGPSPVVFHMNVHPLTIHLFRAFTALLWRR
jgi:hypothetical protein